MTRHMLVGLFILGACGTPTSAPAAKAMTEPANVASAFHLALGDATIYELVDRRWNKREKPTRELVLHADGTAELINDKTDKPWVTFLVKEDGSVFADRQPVATISEHAITELMTDQPTPLSIDGNTISIEIDHKTVKVVLATDGNITVIDRPDGNKWRIDANDPAVMRTAFLVLGLEMKVALD